MKVKMKRCISCNILLSNSSKVCTKCGSKEIEKGFYTDKSYKQYKIQYNKHLNKPNSCILCPTCSAPVTIKDGHGECCFCDDEISVISDGASTIIDSFYQEFIDDKSKE